MNNTLKSMVRKCEWLSDQHYSVSGKRNIHRGICTAKGSVCTKVIESGKCPMLLGLISKLENEDE